MMPINSLSANRRGTRQVRVGNIVIGGSAPIVVQSMTNTDTVDIDATVKQVAALAQAGSELVRIADREGQWRRRGNVVLGAGGIVLEPYDFTRSIANFDPGGALERQMHHVLGDTRRRGFGRCQCRGLGHGDA